MNIGAFLLLIMLAISSCTSFDLHENFINHMSSNVGLHITDKRSWAAQPSRFVSTQLLENGNSEHKYLFYRTCFYFFEEDSKTGILVGWRFEGSKEDCTIPP